MFRFLRIFAFAAFIHPFSAAGQPAIAGVVLDHQGSPVPNSFVEAFPIRSGGFVGDLLWTRVDEHGKFRLNVHEGRYEIRAKHESEGYPDPNALLSADATAVFPEVDVSTQEISGIVVKLGLRGGMLEGAVLDKATQSALPKAKVTIRDARDPRAFVEVFTDETGHFQFTVPRKPLRVSASAHGYRASDPEAVTLSAGEHRSVVLELQFQ